MSKHESYDTHVYVDDRDRPVPVGMYTDEHSPVCSIRFGNSFTLSVVDPLMLETLICELQEFADAAHELHYGPKPRWQRVEPLGEEMAQLQQKLEDCGVGMNEFMEEQEINAARARYLREEETSTSFDPTTLPEAMAVLAEGVGLQRLPEPSKVERLMKGTVSAPQIDPMNDPMNW